MRVVADLEGRVDQLVEVGGAEVIGPVLMGMAKPVNVLQQGASVQDVVNLAAMTAVRAQGELTY